MYTMKYIVPEYFPEGQSVSTLQETRKTEEYLAPRTTSYNPEYMTLGKILSFLHAALLMRGQIISFSDLKRYTKLLSRAMRFLTSVFCTLQGGFGKVSFLSTELISFCLKLCLSLDVIRLFWVHLYYLMELLALAFF